MNKMNKKGFTLIEMLVVIAIIAVLVSIIIPTVTSATDKAAAATNAANLRSMIAEATTKYLTADDNDTGNVQLTFVNGEMTDVEPTDNAPTSKKCGDCKADLDAGLYFDEEKAAFVAHFGGYTLEDFQAVAAGEKAPSEMSQSAADKVPAAPAG